MTPHGVGIDVVDVPRFGRLVERHAERFTRRWFTARERSECAGSPSPARELAARFALKEAAWKALGVGSRADPLPWRAIETRRTGSGEWRVVLTGPLGRHASAVQVGTFVCSAEAGDSVAVAIVHAYRP